MGGGGVAGYAFHTGALAALEEATGWDPRTAEVIVGTSSGSIVASVLRAGVGTFEFKHRVMAVGPMAETDGPLDALVGPDSFRIPDLLRGPAAPALVAAELRRGRRLRASNLLVGALPTGRVPTDPLRGAVERFHDQPWPADPLWITVTDQLTGSRIVLGRNSGAEDEILAKIDIATAVQASCAIPGYFAPVEIGGRQYVDGGMRSPDNSDLLVGEGLDIVVVLSPLSIDELRFRRWPTESLLRAYPRRQLRQNVNALRRSGADVLVVEPDGALARAIGINAMSPAKLRPVVTATGEAVANHLTRLDELAARHPLRRAKELLVSLGRP